MSQYFHDFVDGLTGWTGDRWGSSTTWSVGGTNSDELRENSSSYEGITLDALDADSGRADIEVVGQYNLGAATSAAQRTYALRGDGGTTDATSNYYYCRTGGTSGAQLAVGKNINGTKTAIATLSRTISTGTFYWVRFRVNGTSLKLRVWLVGDAEPGTWDIDTTDSAISAAGYNGCLASGNSTVQAWKYIGFGTGGDTAPTSAPVGGSLLLPRRVLRQQHLLIR